MTRLSSNPITRRPSRPQLSGILLFIAAFIAILAVTIFTIRYNLKKTSGDPSQDLIGMMANKFTTNTNLPQ
jgi:hypothetical protein